MLQKVTLLFCLLFYSLNGTYISSFTDEIVWGSVKTDCDFNLTYTDSNLTETETKVRCVRISKKKITVDYVHEAKSMHTLSLRLRISKSGKTKVLSSSVEKSKYICKNIELKNQSHLKLHMYILILIEQCPIGYSSLCKSDQSNDVKTAICPALQVKAKR